MGVSTKNQSLTLQKNVLSEDPGDISCMQLSSTYLINIISSILFS